MGISARIIERSPIFGPQRALKAGGSSAAGPICPLFPDNIVKGSGKLTYRVLRPFAEGGMSILYEVREEGSGTLHLLKMLKDLSDYDQRTQAEIRKRFRREVRILHAIHHPDLLPAEFAQHRNKVIRLVDWDSNWKPTEPDKAFPRYYIEEKIAGYDLRTAIQSRQPVDPLNATTIMYSVMLGLVVFGEVAERLGEGTVAHRDLKPENIMLEMVGGHVKRVVLIDFGIAHLAREFDENVTRTGIFCGTPAYCAPENSFDSKRADMRSDIFAAGEIYFELLTGRASFDPEDPNQVNLFRRNPQSLVDRLAEEIRNEARIPVNVRMVLFRALYGHPDQRYQTYKEFANVLWDLTQKLQRV
jgi:serine/threonine-protein kinase